MVPFFMNEDNGLELLERWAKRNMTFNWILYVAWGIPQGLLWFLYMEPRMKADPEGNIPSWEPEFYNDLTFDQWVWHRLCSMDAQMLLPLMMSGILDFLEPNVMAKEGDMQEIFIERSFAFWTWVEYNGDPENLQKFLADRMAEHSHWVSYMLTFSLLLWLIILILLVYIPYLLALRHYCSSVHGLDSPDDACQHAFWQHIDIGFGWPSGGFFYDWDRDIQLDYDKFPKPVEPAVKPVTDDDTAVKLLP